MRLCGNAVLFECGFVCVHWCRGGRVDTIRGMTSATLPTDCDPIAAAAPTDATLDDLFASVDVGGTSIGLGIGRADGTLVAETEFPTESHLGADAVVERIGREVAKLASEHGQPKRLGIGLPGIVDAKAGLSKFLPNMP